MSPTGHIIRLSTISLPGELDRIERDEAARRLMTFIDQGDDRYGGGAGKAVKLSNCFGDNVCLKNMRVPTKGGVGRAAWQKQYIMRERALRDEYICQRVVLGLPCFLQTCGYGTYAGGPVLVTEWINGITLRQLSNSSLTTLDCASIGFSIASALICARLRDAHFVHRDLSPLNIMIRTDRMSLEEQRANHTYDVCIIDMGSAICSRSPDIVAARTCTIDGLRFAWRDGTPEYAAPEMLTRKEGPNLALRCSERVDTYELCSVLFELCTGTTPYRLSEREGIDYAYIKNNEQPLEPTRWPLDGKGLRDYLLDSLKGRQSQRPSLSEFADTLLAMCHEHNEETARILEEHHGQLRSLASISAPLGETVILR